MAQLMFSELRLGGLRNAGLHCHFLKSLDTISNNS
jgi:hypothetical protein